MTTASPASSSRDRISTRRRRPGWRPPPSMSRGLRSCAIRRSGRRSSITSWRRPGASPRRSTSTPSCRPSSSMPRHCSARTAATCCCGTATATSSASSPSPTSRRRCSASSCASAKVSRRRRSWRSGRSRSTDYRDLRAPRRGARQVRLRVRAVCAAHLPRRRDRCPERPRQGRPARFRAGRRRPARGLRRSCRHRHRSCAALRERGPPGSRPGRDEPGDHAIAERAAGTRRAGAPGRRPARDRRGPGRAPRAPCRHPGPPPSGHRRSRTRTAATNGADSSRSATRTVGERPVRRRSASPSGSAAMSSVTCSCRRTRISGRSIAPWSMSPRPAWHSSSPRSARPPRSRNGCAGRPPTELLTGSYPSEDAIAARAARLGYDLGDPARPAGDRRRGAISASPTGRTRTTTGSGGSSGRSASGWRPARPRSLAIGHLGSVVVLAAVGRDSPMSRGRSPTTSGAASNRWPIATRSRSAIGTRCTRPDDYALRSGWLAKRST